MVNRKKAVSDIRDQAASQRPDPVSNAAPQPPPVETPSPSAAPVTQDQFALLVQQVQALAGLIEGYQKTSRPAPAVPAPRFPEEDVVPLSPAASSSGPLEAAEPPLRPKGAKPALYREPDRNMPEPRRARSLSPVYSHHDSSPHRLHPSTLPDEEIRRQLQEMRRELDAAKLAQPPQPGMGLGIPFSKGIMAEIIPSYVKLPAIEPYHGSTDPDDHLSSFRSMMMFHGASDAVLCRAFPSTLRGSARTWFSSLKPGSVDSFDELSHLFIGQFVSSRRHRRRSDSLSEVKQREGETLRNYLGRFNRAMLEVDNLNHEVAMSALAGGISKESDLYLAMEVSYPPNLSEMMALADKYARVEESRRAARTEQMKKKELKVPDRYRPARQPSPPRRQRAPAPPPPPRNRSRSPPRRFDRYTPLTVPRAQILMEIERQLPRPPPLRGNPTLRDPTKYCRYHREHGHDTEECWQLKNEIERLIQRGRLDRFRGAPEPRNVGDRRPEPQQQPQQPPPLPPNPPIAGHINVIETAIDPHDRGNEEGASAPKKMRSDELSFSDEDLQGIQYPHDDALVVSLNLNNYDVSRVLVDSGSSVNVLYYDVFLRMKSHTENLRPVDSTLMGFTGDVIVPEGVITLAVRAGTWPVVASIFADFLVTRLRSPYNAILGRPGLMSLKAVISIPHLSMKFPTERGAGVVRGSQTLARQCFVTSLQSKIPEVDGLDAREDFAEQRGEPAEELEEVPLDEARPDRTIRVGSSTKGEARQELISFLRGNADVFAWSASDMPGINPDVLVHRLSVDDTSRPVKQKKRSFAPERQKAIEEEVNKLLKADFIREVDYPTWLSNVVMVKKSNGKWRICIDFTDLNKACPKDSFPLPRIDQLVDATSGHQMLSFMDAYSGYNQIRMAPEDEEKTAFITDRGIYCYKVMPFGLKNAGATYQRLVNKVFKDQIGRNMEVYVDDMLVKSREAPQHIKDLSESFGTLRRYQMKLNPTKCAFGVTSGKFLGFMVSQRGIEANPQKIQALQQMAQPASTKDVQRLTGRIAALNRFVARSAERCLPFFKTLRSAKNFRWTPECQAAFDDLKRYLGSTPLLSSPAPGEPLFLYLAVSEGAVGSVLIREENKIQKPVYYISKLLRDAETRYTRVEKMVLALVTSVRKLRPYFQAHSVTVLTDQPIKAIIHRPETSGRMTKWAVELSEHDIQFRPRPAIKAQVLADFLLECTIPEDGSTPDSIECPSSDDRWLLHTDGSSNAHCSGAGLVLTNPEGATFEYGVRFSFPASNNEAEYEALLSGLRIARDLKVKKLNAFTDSQLVAGHIRGEFEAREPNMVRYLQEVRKLLPSFTEFDIIQVPRAENARADLLSRLATSESMDAERSFHLETLERPSIADADQVMQLESEPSWFDPMLEYLKEGSLPADRREARKLKLQSTHYVLVDGRLYKRSFSMPLLRCLRPSEADYALREVHEGICGNHLGSRSLCHKVLRQGYYWPTMQKDADDLVRACDPCQRHSNIQRLPSADLVPISSAWPFAKWGMDILGPFPPATGQRKFLFVAIDYFTKWVEAEAVAQITEARTEDFVWRSIICRFGLPHTIITDNGKQFDNRKFRQFCEEHGIYHRFTSVGHPQSNGAAEVTNRTLLQGIKARLSKARGRWVDELHHVLWAYRTTPRVPTGETPFRMAFGTEAVIPVEMGLPSLRVASYSEEASDEQLRTNLDLVEEIREKAQIRTAAYQQKVAHYHASRIKGKAFSPGDLVLRKASVSKPLEQGKLAPNWEGPYQIAEVVGPGTYKLQDSDGRSIPRTWNSDNLRKYHQ